MSKVKATKEKLIELYVNDDRATMQSVADKLGCSRSAVLRGIQRYGLPSKPHGTQPAKVIPELDNREWLTEQLETKTMGQLASELGVASGRIASRAYGYGIKTPATDKGKAISDAIKKRYPNGRFGENASNWKGGKVHEGRGYTLVYMPSHPFSKDGTHVYEHRLIMEKHLGRYLGPNDIVHHINGIKNDNRLENLKLMTRAEHSREHWVDSLDAPGLREENRRLHKSIDELEETVKQLEKRVLLLERWLDDYEEVERRMND